MFVGEGVNVGLGVTVEVGVKVLVGVGVSVAVDLGGVEVGVLVGTNWATANSASNTIISEPSSSTS